MRRKISQILVSLARKWNIQERNGLATLATWLKQRESITHNSNVFGGPLQFELSKFHCIHINGLHILVAYASH